MGWFICGSAQSFRVLVKWCSDLKFYFIKMLRKIWLGKKNNVTLHRKTEMNCLVV